MAPTHSAHSLEQRSLCSTLLASSGRRDGTTSRARGARPPGGDTAVTQRRIGAFRFVGGIRVGTLDNLFARVPATMRDGDSEAHTAAFSCGAALCSLPRARSTGSRLQRDAGDACDRELNGRDAAKSPAVVDPRRGCCSGVKRSVLEWCRRKDEDQVSPSSVRRCGWRPVCVTGRRSCSRGHHPRRTVLRPSSGRAQCLRLSSV